MTEQQTLAIETRGVSVLLSSGAGCGKTHVLTARYLSHLSQDGAGVGEVVAITFTERAAREMRSRIRAAVTERVRTADSPITRDRWAGHRRDLESAPITTIHSFCGNLLRQYAVTAGLDPQFQILDDVLAGNLRAEATAATLRELLTAERQAGDDLRELVVLYGWSAVVSAIEHLTQSPDRAEWRQWLTRDPSAVTDQWVNAERAALLPEWVDHVTAAVPKVANCLSLLAATECKTDAMRANAQRLLTELPRLQESADLAGTIKELCECAKVGKDRAKAWPDDETYERVKAGFTDLRAALPDRMSLFTDDPGDVSECVTWGQRFLRVADEVVAGYEFRKAQKGILDFDDLLLHTRNLLRDVPEAQSALRQRYRFVLVDEFQDTDPVQIDLVGRLCRSGLDGESLFVVGDQKQSIYRFRGADVALFQGLRDRLPAEGRLGLTLNFRSQPGVLDFVNGLCEARFPDYEPLEPSHGPVHDEACVRFLWAVTGPGDADKESVAEVRAREADAIAGHLRALFADESPRVRDRDTGEERPAHPRDVAILFRSMSHVAIYESALRKHGLDYYLVGGRAFFAQQEIYDLLNVLKAIENPTDTVSLVGTLRSPFCCLSDDTVFALSRHADGVWGGLRDRSWHSRLPEKQRDAADRARQFLTRWRSLKDRLGISALLGEIFADSGYDAAMLFEFLGERKLANLWKLRDLARSFDGTGLFGLADFIARLDELVRTQPREEQAATMPENADVIKLMSIHQSKGLEFPVVIVPDLSAAQRGQQLPVATWDRHLGCLAKPPGDEPEAFSEFAWKLGRASASVADWQEDLRVLYVACTRARDLLILSAGLPVGVSADDRDLRPTSAWMLALAERYDLSTGEYRHDAPQNGRLPKVRVHWSTPADSDAVPPAEPDTADWEEPRPFDTETVSSPPDFEYIDADQWPQCR